MFCILVLYSLMLLLPLLWGFFTSLKTMDAFMQDLIWPTLKPTFNNYVDAFTSIKYQVATETTTYYVYFPEMLLNSVLYAVGTAFFNTLITCLTAYLVAKFPNRFSKFVYGIVIVTMILPIVGALPAQIRMARLIGLFDSIPGLWLINATFTNFYFLVFYAVFKSVAKDYSEAASIDGAGNFTIMLKLMFPLIRNTFLIVFLLLFIGRWNDYATPMLMLPSYPTISNGIFHYAFSDTAMEMTKSAGGIIMLLPVLVIYMLFYKKMMGNFSVGGIKG